MNARERWQALQTHLTAARAAVDHGDRAGALAAVNAALELDPNFLAAHSLRDRILAGEVATPIAAPPPRPAAVVSAATAPPAAIPHVSREGYAQFEQRAKRRRVDRRIDAARQAIERKRLKQAASALDEVIELDPNLPELGELTAQFDELRRSIATPHRGPWLVAAVVFGASVLGASWLQESSPLFSRSMIGAAPLLAAPTPSAVVSAGAEPVGTAGTSAEPDVDRDPILTAERTPAPPAPEYRSASTVMNRPAIEPLQPIAAPVAAPAPALPLPAPPPPAAPRIAMPETMIVAPVATPVPPRIEQVDDRALVQQTLQRYRTAYEALDAQSAHAVWPAVNQVALTRAFDGLASQTITFDACDVRVRGEDATATCQGSARYVPKVGSREPRTEPRTWNFKLRKSGTDWQIDSAHAQR